MKIKDLFLARGRFRFLDGNQTRFWEDLWTGGKPFMVRYLTLYNIVKKKHAYVSVVEVLSTTPLNISFRLAIVGDKLSEWLDLVGKVLLDR